MSLLEKYEKYEERGLIGSGFVTSLVILATTLFLALIAWGFHWWIGILSPLLWAGFWFCSYLLKKKELEDGHSEQVHNKSDGKPTI